MQHPQSPDAIAVEDAEDLTLVGVRIAPPAPEQQSVHEPAGRPWELELLISGAVVFALVQLPAVIDRLFDEFSPHLSGALRQVAMSAYMVSSLVLSSLIAAFVIHLAGRAYWVGLVGLDAVFPNGVRWEKTSYGPIARGLRQAQQPSLQKLTNSADKFCSIIFSYAFATAMALVAGMLLALVITLITVGISNAFFAGRYYLRLFIGAYAVVMVFMIVPVMVDRRWGDRLDPHGRAAGFIRAATRTQYAVMFSRAYMPILDVLSSNVRRWVVVAISTGAIVVLAGAFFLKLMKRDDGMDFAYDYLPARGSAATVEYRHYLNQRTADEANNTEPAIQSDVIREPLIRLFLPYSPRRHDELLRSRCPGAAPRGDRPEAMGAEEFARTEAAREAAVLRCLTAMQPVTLNGVVRDDLRFRFYAEPTSGLRGILAYIPTAGLPEGENTLVVPPIPVPPSRFDEDAEPEPPHFIPFWIAR